METITITLDEYRQMTRELLASIRYFAETYGDLNEYKALIDDIDDSEVEFILSLAKEFISVR